MNCYNKNIDAYLAESAAFAKPIPEHFREPVNAVCPEVKKN